MAWCIYQEGAEITNAQRIDHEDFNDHTWILRNAFRPYSQLVIFEPDGCRKGTANSVTALGFDQSVRWRGRLWDQVRVRLRSDGSCDLKLLVPLYDGDPLEWAFGTGRALLAACGDDRCTPIVPTIADVTSQYRSLFRREAGRAIQEGSH